MPWLILGAYEIQGCERGGMEASPCVSSLVSILEALTYRRTAHENGHRGSRERSRRDELLTAGRATLAMCEMVAARESGAQVVEPMELSRRLMPRKIAHEYFMFTLVAIYSLHLDNLASVLVIPRCQVYLYIAFQLQRDLLRVSACRVIFQRYLLQAYRSIKVSRHSRT